MGVLALRPSGAQPRQGEGHDLSTVVEICLHMRASRCWKQISTYPPAPKFALSVHLAGSVPLLLEERGALATGRLPGHSVPERHVLLVGEALHGRLDSELQVTR
eukprot:4454470-Pyramimonas_sp.AAC.1